MSHHPRGQGQPVLGATFIPGGIDDYYMPGPAPELVSPAPQRIMPEVPENMQDNIEHLELEANSTHRPPPGQGPPQTQNNSYQQNMQQGYDYGHQNQGHAQPPPPAQQSTMTLPVRGSSLANHSSHASQSSVGHVQPNASHDYTHLVQSTDLPNFSPFPRIQNRPHHVPPTDDEKESILEGARTTVLNSNDPETQLAWAQDALTYVEISMLHDQRISETQPGRSVTPAIEHQIRVDAINVVSFLADQHHPRAEFIKGMWLEFGKFGMRVDKKDAFRSYSRAADKGYSRAEYRMGMQFEQSNDPVKALIHYKRGSEAGDSASNYRLGMMTLLGQHGQQQDYAKGVQLIRQAASNADENAPQGAYVLGMLQARELPQINIPEIFLPYDERLARQNVEKAAYLGFAKAQLKMGSAYELCTLGCEFSPALSLHYNALAARQGEPEADMAISKWFLCGYEGVFAKNEDLAYTYAQRAAQAGLATGEFAMGYFNEIGMHTSVNLDKAVEWYQKAAAQGNKDAESRIESLSKSKTLSKKDHEHVAISRIKSQHGSMRGVRPEKFRTPAPPLPSIPDSEDSTPVTAGPNRNAASTPYPLSDQPPTVPLQHDRLPERPATVAPYPVGDEPPRLDTRIGSGGGSYLGPDYRPASAAPGGIQRPSSAFQINPNLAGPGPRPSSDRPVPPRAYASVDDLGTGRNARPPAGYAGGQRIASNPSPGGYGQPGPYDYDNRPYDNRPDRRQSPGPRPNPQPPKVDVGYAGPDDRRNPAQKPQNAPGADFGFEAPLQAKPPQKPQPAPGGGRRPDQPSSGRPQEGSGAGGRPGGRPLSPAGGVSPRPSPSSQGGLSSKPLSGQPQKPSGGLPQKPLSGQPQKPAGQQQQPAKPAGAPAQAAKPAARPPSKGPKTFDEMGIAQGKKQDDCVVM